MDGAELELFARSIRSAVEKDGGSALDAALDDLGWPDALAEDRRAATSLLFESQGAANAASSGLDHVLSRALGLADPAPAVVQPALREWTAPGRVDGDRCSVGGLATRALPQRDRAVLVARDQGVTKAFALAPGSFELRPVKGIDPDLALVEVLGDVDLGATEPLGPVAWDAAVCAGQLALAHELVGAARAMLELARQHALDRVQFGRPISSFQAIRHRLADSLVATEAASALVDAAWEDPAAYAAMAKGFAGRQARLVARHGQQVLAGIGFTTEHPFHRYVRRTLVLDQLLGAGTVLRRGLGARVLESGTLPPAFPL